MSFQVKDSGKRQEFASGMVRDTQDGKAEYHRIYDGPLVDRFAAHLTKGAQKYPDNEDGTPNWTNANSKEEMLRFRKSAARHFRQWMRGDQDEDHFAATTFNMNCYEYTKERLCRSESIFVPSVDSESSGSSSHPIPACRSALVWKNTDRTCGLCNGPCQGHPFP